MAGSLCAEIEREDVSTLTQVEVGIFEDDTGVADEDTTNGIERANLVEGRHRDNDLVKDGHRAPHESRVATLGHHSKSPRVAVL